MLKVNNKGSRIRKVNVKVNNKDTDDVVLVSLLLNTAKQIKANLMGLYLRGRIYGGLIFGMLILGSYIRGGGGPGGCLRIKGILQTKDTRFHSLKSVCIQIFEYGHFSGSENVHLLFEKYSMNRHRNKKRFCA